MNKILKRLLAVAVSGPALMAATPSQALTFNLIDTGGAGAGSQARAGFEAAAFYWSSVLTDNITVNLQIGFVNLGSPNILGQAGSSTAAAYNTAIYGALATDATSALDNSAVLKSLQGGALNMVVNQTANSDPTLYSDKGTRLDNDGSANNFGLAVNTANMKALGLTSDANGNALAAVDAEITFNSGFAFDFDPTDGVPLNQYDFIGVAIHEIGHALGFVSGVDIYDYYTYDIAGNPANAGGLLDDYFIGSVLDLFRYSADGLDWSTSDSDKYFSIDGGNAFMGDAGFSTGSYNGNGRQASHWLPPQSGNVCLNFVGVMNPYLCDGELSVVTAQDLGAFDAIGWDVNVDVLANPGYLTSTADVYRAFNAPAVPEPASWLMMIGGLAMIGGVMRVRARKVAFA